jgi:hypothetical protein
MRAGTAPGLPAAASCSCFPFLKFKEEKMDVRVTERLSGKAGWSGLPVVMLVLAALMIAAVVTVLRAA